MRVHNGSTAVLSPEEFAHFSERGWVRLHSAFPREAAERICAFMWDHLRQRHGSDPADPATWRWTVNGLNRTAHDPIYREVDSPRLRGAITQILGHSRWRAPARWGGFLVDAPHGGDEDWRIPTDGWHWDGLPCPAIRVFTLYAPLAPRDGGTLLADGTHRLVRRFLANRAITDPRMGILHREFNRSHPWLARLTGAEPCSSDRIAEFTATTFDADGLPLRVSEVTGEPGDAVLCDSSIHHARPTRIGPRPRVLCVTGVK